ncbi:biotin transporter BioY [Alphaproteobacteria bacterium]|jgi:biotin transport system substrate-specific component|nr:biotin transporter BioY [Alphaproteobacteria bacterium]MDB9871857.1 biotin transporter BioY [Alphaproteobacteria bacterium]|tara:strand:- start:695 stop:1282 length:588 start_codon:yes stop_codon:yes gene_type:complete
MLNNNGLATTWIESFILKGNSKDKFSILTSTFTIIICSILLIISAKIKVDLYTIPMTMQPLAILIIAMLCGRNLAACSISLYLFQGMIGLPVFANGGGMLYLMGPTGGFLFGFLIAGIIMGELADRGWGQHILKAFLAMLLGLFIIYFFGIIQLSLFLSFEKAILMMKLYMIGDFYKLLLATLLVPQIWKLTKKH